MQTLEQPGKYAADLYRLAYLLTGKQNASLDITLEILNAGGGKSSFFSKWMLDWSRRIVIAKALAALRDDLANSVRRVSSQRAAKFALPPREWSLDAGATATQLERALLAIDVFPRCTLLLCVFEGMPLADVAILLDAAPKLVRKARIVGLRELTRNLANAQGWTPSAPAPFLIAGEMQHA